MKGTLKILLKRNLEGPFILRCLLRFFLVIIVVASQSTKIYPQVDQKITVTGTVIDGSTKEPMIGVNVIIQGTLTGTTTDLSGKFIITVPTEQAVLEFSFIGYNKQIITVGKQRQISIALVPNLKALEEVVVVGYGVQKKESVVGAVGQVNGEIVKSTVQGSDLANALTGALPGLITISTSGIPGGQGNENDYTLMYIRGDKTWNNAAPLILVDGVERPLVNINPYEIEKFSILKDASATAVFGVKGANGVILITTYRGKVGKPVLTFDVTTTAKTISRTPYRLGSYEANLMKNYAILNEVPTTEASWASIVPYRWLELYKSQQYPDYLPDVNWKDVFSKKWAWDQNMNLTLSGGTKIVKYFGSFSYLNEDDILNIKNFGHGYSPNFSFNRFNFRSNLDFDITPTTRFSANFAGFYSNQTIPGGDPGLGTLYTAPPDRYPPIYSDGTWSQSGIYSLNFSGYNTTKITNINTDFIFDQKLDFITKGLSFAVKFSYDNTANSTGPNLTDYGKLTKWISPYIVDDPALRSDITAEQLKALELKYTTWYIPASAPVLTGYNFVEIPTTYSTESGANESTYRSLYYQSSLNYGRDFGKHSVSGLALMSRQIQATGSTFANYREDWVGRVTYSYDKRYLLELNGAYNGSEKFAPKYRFGFFPSMAVGWVVSNESFFENLRNIVSNLKFRYSDGMVGSDAGIARWLYVSDWIVRTTSYSFGYPTLQSAYPYRYEGVIANPEIQWETAHKKDYGIETGFFNDQLKILFDYFTEDRTNIFVSSVDRAVPAFFGADPVSVNIGEVKVHGWEFELQFSRTSPRGLTYWFNHSWSFTIDKIIEKGDPILKPFYQKQAGYQIGEPRYPANQSVHPMLTWDDIYNAVTGTSNAYRLPGDFAQVDYNGDGIIDTNDDIPYGYPSRPQFNYAPSAGITYKNLSANVRFYGVYNVEGEAGIYGDPSIGSHRVFNSQQSIVFPLERDRSWSPEFNNTATSTYAAIRFVTNSQLVYIPTSRAYFKLQHAEIGYNVTSQFLKRMGVSRLRFLLSGENLILWSKMEEDFDAMRPTFQTHTRRMYPKFKRYSFGVSLAF